MKKRVLTFVLMLVIFVLVIYGIHMLVTMSACILFNECESSTIVSEAKLKYLIESLPHMEEQESCCCTCMSGAGSDGVVQVWEGKQK